MKRFIKLTIAFSLVFLTVLFLIIESSEIIIKNNANFKLKPQTKYLVLGHSHPECAFNDSLIKNLKNLAQTGESYYYTYFKTIKVLEQNPSIEIVFIEFTNNQIYELMNNWIWGNMYMDYRYPKYSPFMSLSDKFILIKNNPSGFINASSLAFEQNFKRIRKQNFNYSNWIGGYLFLKRYKTDSLLKSSKWIDYKQKQNIKLSELNLKYLTKIIDLCEQNNRKVILIRSPLHSKSESYASENIYQQIRATHFSSNEFLDFSKFPSNNSEFGDLEHLNFRGAKVFSNWFSNLLKSGVLEKRNKHEFINAKIKMQENKNSLLKIEH